MALLDIWTERSYTVKAMQIGRPREFDPDEVLDKAMQLFWTKGYEATSLEDLLETMGLSKSSFYQTFQSKHQVFERSIDQYRELMEVTLRERLRHAKSGLAFIEETLASVGGEACRMGRPRGCLFMNSASEFAQRDPAIDKLVREGVGKMTDLFMEAVTRAQKEGEISAKRNPRSLARYLVNNLSGLNALAKAGMDPKSLSDIVGVVVTALR